MKTAAAMVSMVLVLLSAGVTLGQTAMMGSGAHGGIRATPRPSTPVRPPITARHPTFVRPAVLGRPAVGKHAVFPARSFFPWNRFVGARGIVAPWPYWYAYPPQAYLPTQYWAYCQSLDGYYPYVQYCPEGWQPVVPPLDGWQGASGTGQESAGGMSIEEIRDRIARSRAEPEAEPDRGLEIVLSGGAGPRPTP